MTDKAIQALKDAKATIEEMCKEYNIPTPLAIFERIGNGIADLNSHDVVQDMDAAKQAELVSMIIDHGMLRYRMGCSTQTHKDLAFKSELLMNKIQAAILGL